MKARLTEMVSFRVDKTAIAEVDRIAKKQERSRAQVVRRLFIKGLQAESDDSKRATA